MWSLNYSSISSIASILEENGLAMSKKFGQNFLISPEARERIVSLIGAGSGECVWEIGPGLGAITHLLLKRGCVVNAFEIDHGFASLLREKAFPDEAFTLIEGDALDTLFERECDAEYIVGNLPYNVGSQLIARLIERSVLPRRMVFTLQKEVADRMTARAGSAQYSSFSVLTQLDYSCSVPYTIKSGSFYPSPKVDSAVVVMEKKNESVIEGEERAAFLRMVRVIFSQRRKTIRNNLSQYAPKEKCEEVFSSLGLSGSERAETLSSDTLIALSKALRPAQA